MIQATKSIAVFFTVFLTTTITSPLHGQETEPALPPRPLSAQVVKVIDVVIRAHGGEAQLRKIKAYMWKYEKVDPEGKTSTVELFVESPDRLRIQTADEGENGADTAIAIDGKTLWSVGDGTSFSGDVVVPLIESFRSGYTSRSPLQVLKLKDLKKAPRLLGESIVKDRAVVGLAIDTDETWFFEKKTGLLSKVESRYKGEDGKVSVYTEIYSDYIRVDGISVARHTISSNNGERGTTMKLLSFETAEKLDDELFPVR